MTRESIVGHLNDLVSAVVASLAAVRSESLLSLFAFAYWFIWFPFLHFFSPPFLKYFLYFYIFYYDFEMLNRFCC